MLFVYPKNEQEVLTPTQLRVLGRLVREEFKRKSMISEN